MHENFAKKNNNERSDKNFFRPKVCLVINFHKSESMLMVIWFLIRKTNWLYI